MLTYGGFLCVCVCERNDESFQIKTISRVFQLKNRKRKEIY